MLLLLCIRQDVATLCADEHVGAALKQMDRLKHTQIPCRWHRATNSALIVPLYKAPLQPHKFDREKKAPNSIITLGTPDYTLPVQLDSLRNPTHRLYELLFAGHKSGRERFLQCLVDVVCLGPLVFVGYVNPG